MPPRQKKNTRAPLTPLIWMLLGAFTTVMVAAAFYIVIPRSGSARESENLTALQQRLDDKEQQRRGDLQRELNNWREKNESLRQEIKRLKEAKK